MHPLVSIVTINYNQPGHTRALLASLRKVTYPSIEIIVVDNGSAQDPRQLIGADFPEAQVIVSKENLGFAGGNNLGIRAAKGKYIFLLNNDTEVAVGAIEPLVELFENTPSAGAASSKILYYNPGDIIQYVGSTDINPYTGRNHSDGFKQKDTGQFDVVRKTQLAHGAAMMIPRSVIDQVGLMPEHFFLYYEELDWCMTIRKAGYDIYVVPASVVLHKESMSIGKNSELKTFYLTRNRLLFMRRHTSGVRKLSWILFFLFFSIPKNVAVYLLHGKLSHLTAFWKGCTWNLTHRKDDGLKKFKTE
jgi:GT2 family glycosyltransferase